MDSEEYRVVAKAVIDEIADYYDNIESPRVVSAVEPGYLRPLLPDSAPLDPEPFDAIRADVREKILPGITHWASPRFMAFFPCSSSYPAALGEMYSTAFNGAHFNWVCSPAATELETVVLDWLAKALGLPECYLSTGPTHGGGVIHGTASEAILTVMVAARDRYLAEVTAHLPEGEEKEEQMWRHRSKLVALGGGGAHSATLKAAQILGVRFKTVSSSAEEGYALTGETLEKALAELRGKGLEPFYLTATFGSTEVCAVDEMEGIARVLAPANSSAAGPYAGAGTATGAVWVHVDAAYAGSALLLEENQHLAAATAAFDSFNVNPHKWMLTTFDCSATWVRRRRHLMAALSVKPPFLRNEFSDSGLVTDYRDWQIPLGRRFRSLKLWFVLRSYGLRGLRAHIRRGVALAERLEGLLRGRPDLFAVFTAARFALLTFRVTGAGAAASSGEGGEGEEEEDKAANNRTAQLYNTVLSRGEFYLTSTVVNTKFAIRVCTGVERVREEHVQQLFEVLVEEAEKIVKGAV
ncbi:Tyrosine decarboxylase [Paramyrothecium foliicola]|nr:Tyrosine decarboxylase [Paramyrothecium foliicola]